MSAFSKVLTLLVMSSFLANILFVGNVESAETHIFPGSSNGQVEYYGKMSFRLEEDAGYSVLKSELENLRAAGRKLKNEIDGLNTKIKTSQAEYQQLEKKQKDCQTTPTPECQAEEKTVTEKMEKIQESIKQNKEQLEAKTQESDTLEPQIKTKGDEVDRKKNSLTAGIYEFNKGGFEKGREDGQTDGIDLAEKRGHEYGRNDGRSKGTADGEREGRRREKQAGFEEGATVGKNKAEADGKTHGTIDGTKAGNSAAARQDGEQAGRLEAEKSNAAGIGMEQGEAAGFKRAVSVGKENGERQGEAEAVEKYEKSELKETTVLGTLVNASVTEPHPVDEKYLPAKFSPTNMGGSFTLAETGDIPSFPENFTYGSSYRSWSPTTSTQIFKKAFRDGYDFGYQRAVRNAYGRNVNRFYETEYKLQYQQTFDFYVALKYSDSRQAGYDEGRTAAYHEIYPGIYREYFNQAKEKFSLNPDKNSAEYIRVYDQDFEASYKRNFERIKSENFRMAEDRVFKANIAQQTEKYRQERLAAVSAVYENNPVLKFVSVRTEDAGINDLVKNDGIFQPGETTLHTVTLINYGKKAALNTRLTVSSTGQTFVIPVLPPQTKMMVRGLGSSIPVTFKSGTDFEETITVNSPLQSEWSVQGRHFQKPSDGILKMEKIKFKVEYPVRISGVQSGDAIILGQKNNLSAHIDNFSNRGINGPITFHLSDNASSKVVVKDWKNVENLPAKETANLNDAEILVVNEADTYVPLHFNLVISVNNVVIGRADDVFVTMAKSPYLKTDAGKTVIIADADQDQKNLLAAIQNFSREKTSILDLSLENQIGGLSQTGINTPVAVLLVDEDASVLKKVDQILPNSQLQVLFIANNKSEILKKPGNLNFLNNAVLFPVNLKDFGNQEIFVKGLLSGQTALVFQKPMAELSAGRELAEWLNIPVDEHLRKIRELFDRNGYTNPSQEQKILAQTFNLRVLSEIISINKEFLISGKKDKSIPKRVLERDSLLLNKFLAAVKGTPVTNETLGIHLFAVNLIFTLDRMMNKYLPTKTNFSGEVENAVDNRRKALEQVFKKNLKKEFPAIYKEVYRNEGIYMPFVLK